MRLFVAVPIEAAVRDALAVLQTRLVPMAEDAGISVKWVEAENFHLTVAFLGDLSESIVPDVESACASLANEVAPFRVSVRGMSVFPKAAGRGDTAKEVKTLWAGVQDEGKMWQAMMRRAEPHFVPFGAARDGGLVPHITLGRVKSLPQRKARTEADGDFSRLRSLIVSEAETELGVVSVDTLILMESRLDPRGATYREVFRAALTGQNNP